MSHLKQKYNKLQEIFCDLKQLAVAYSGGIDSTFLLYSAIETLGSENVKVYTCVSDLNAAKTLEGMRNVFATHFAQHLHLHEIQIYPLTWKEFTVNDVNRCYFCKRRMYLAILEEVAQKSHYVLADGTNIDDLKKNRPGLRAIRELNVQTPFVSAELTKENIRLLAQENGIVNANLSSNSCLATRIVQGENITKSQMIVIERAENFLHQLGFDGCRVKVDGVTACIELKKNDFDTFVTDDVRFSVLHKFYDLGISNVSLNLTTR